jgi:hypothetical protein
MRTSDSSTSNSILFFFFPRRHRLPVGSLYGGIISSASLLGIEAILLRFGSVGSIGSILPLARRLKLQTETSPEERSTEERPIVAERIDWRLLRRLLHAVASPFQLISTIYRHKPRGLLVRDLPHALLAAPFARPFGVPVLFVAESRSWHSLERPDPLTGKPPKHRRSALKQRAREAGFKLANLLSSAIIVPSQQVASSFIAYGARPEKVVVSRYPLLGSNESPLDPSARAALLRQYSFPEETFLIVVDVTENDLRTIELFIRAIHVLDLPQVSVLLLGDVAERERVRAVIIGFGLRESIHLTGWVDSPASVYGCADLVVSLPSDAGVGMAALGAMRLGLAVAAFDDADGRETIRQEGQLYPDLNVEHFSAWLRDLILDEQRLIKLRLDTALRSSALAAAEREKMLKTLIGS